MNLISAKTWPGESERSGGAIINPENVLNLHGIARVSFEMKEVYLVTKNTKIKFTVTNLIPLTSKINVGLCVYEQHVESFKGAFVTCVGLFQQPLKVNANDVLVNLEHESLKGNLKNFAFLKKTSQSSTEKQSIPSLAVDGRIGDQTLSIDAVNLNTVTETELEFQPWWQVDFGGVVLIRNLVIFKRVDEYSLSDFKVTIYDSQDNVVLEPFFSGKSGDAKKIEIILPEKVEGRKLRITLTEKSEKSRLCLAEVQVFGFKYDFDLPIGEIFDFSEKVKVNRIGFLQDNGNPEMAYVRIDEITIYEPAIIVEAEVRDFNCLKLKIHIGKKILIFLHISFHEKAI